MRTLLFLSPSQWIRIVRVSLSVLFAFIFTGCISDKAYWRIEPSGKVLPTFAVIPHEHEKDASYGKNLRVIEFDDQGDKWESDQRREAVNLIKSLDDGGLVIVFVHGWQNNADPDRDPNDLARFNNFLKKFSSDKNNTAGIYIGWRGRSVDEDFPGAVVLDKLSFPGRRAATTRLASPAMLDCLWSVRRAANEKSCRVVLVGHSFGARILETVAAPSILAYNSYLKESPVEARKWEERKSRTLGDLIILINPASESLHARQMRLATRHWPEDEPPSIITLTSESDNATGYVWNLGKKLEKWVAPNIPIRDRRYDLGYKHSEDIRHEMQSRFIESTSGHNPSLVTGWITSSEPEFDKYETPKETFYRLTTGCHPVFKLKRELLHKHSGNIVATGKPDPDGVFNSNMVRLCVAIDRATLNREAYRASSLSKFISDTNQKIASE